MGSVSILGEHDWGTKGGQLVEFVWGRARFDVGEGSVRRVRFAESEVCEGRRRRMTSEKAKCRTLS